MPHDEKPSIWKKEMSFRRKGEHNSPDDEGGGGTSIWKKELSLRKKGEDATVSPEPSVEPEPLVVEALEAVPDPEPVIAPEPEPLVPEPVVLAPAAPVEHDWLTKPLEEVSEPPVEQPALPLAEPTPITLVPGLEDPAPALVPEPDPELPPVALAAGIPVLPPPSPEPSLPELPHVTVAELPTVELPAVELPAPEPSLPVATAAAEATPSVPFYKRDFSLKRKPRERTPKAERPKRERKAKAKPEAGEKKPFYKRELSAKRKPQQWDAAEPAAAPKPKLRRVPRPKPSLPGPVGSTKKIVGLKIGGSQIAAARIHNNGSPELVQAVRGPLEHGIVVGGELRDPEALAVALKDFFTLHKLPKRGVRLGIANNRIGVRTFEVVGIDDPKQLANAIRFRAQEVLPIPIEEAVLDFQVLSESVNDEGQPVRRVLLVVAYRELVDRYIYACRKAGIQVVGIDLEAFALLRAVSEPHDPVAGTERGAVVAVSVGHDRSTFAVSDGRVCEFTRVLEWGGSALNVAIARALEMSPSEAEPIKRSLSLTGSDEVPEGFTADQVATALEAARKQLQTFARELVSSLQFYQNQPGSLGIGEIALTGGTAHLPGLAAELERLIGVPVRVADPMGRVKVSKKLREVEQVGSLAIAIGLGIED
jgi:type IV pilus assembly protein PilM